LPRYFREIREARAVKEPSALLSFSRRATRRRIFTVPFLLQVGLYVVVVGPARDWSPIAPTATADKSPQVDLVLQGGVPQRDLHAEQEFVLHRSDQPLDHGDAAALADRAKAGADTPTPTPEPISCGRPKLAAFIADEIPRWGPGSLECSAKEAA
jgi:hypothetical protein